jgi:hypothetical protein
MTKTGLKEVGMGKMTVSKFLCLVLLILVLIPFSNVRANTAEELIGQEITYFTLPSTEDRAIKYVEDYYGKYYLIMTFFPAAFTPI